MARFGSWLKALLPLILLLLLVVYWLHWTLSRPVGQVAIYGEVRHADLQGLQERALPWLTDAFWKVNLKGLQVSLERDPWLQQVNISRRWPDQIQIELVERKAWARWNQTAFVDERGQGFAPVRAVDLPLERWIEAESENLADAVALWHHLEPLLQAQALQLTGLKSEKRGAWQLELNGAVRVLVGRDNMESRINRFLWAWQHWLADEAPSIEKIDLRYPNGLSVAWLKSGYE